MYKMEVNFGKQPHVSKLDVERLCKVLDFLGFDSKLELKLEELILSTNQLEKNIYFNQKTFNANSNTGKLEVLEETVYDRYVKVFWKIANRNKLPISITSSRGLGSKMITYSLSIYNNSGYFGETLVGYQGIKGSNSQIAAKNLVQKLKLDNVRFIPLITSKRVIDKLKSGEIDYGVVATYNNIGGEVKETTSALKSVEVEFLAKETLPIHHCLFAKEYVCTHEIKAVASHPQALKQCSENITRELGEVELKEIGDTALGAVYLSKNRLKHSTAVLCSKSAGLHHGLELLFDNFEDTEGNQTEFKIYKFSLDL